MKLAVAGLAMLTACSPTAVRAPLVSPSPSAAPPLTPVHAFSFAAVRATIGVLATTIGPREAVSAAYRGAVAAMRARIMAIGYHPRVLDVPVPAGRVHGVAEPAGKTYDVIGEPPGYDPTLPHLVVCGHLDTVPGSPGANDNASGVAIALELARLARDSKLKVPVVFVAFGAEESRVQRRGVLPPKYGSRAYIASLSRAERASIKGVLNLDMVGAGSIVHIGNSGSLWLLAFREARKLKMKIALEVSKLSDHTSFEAAHLPVVWFWSGMHWSFHLPSDRAGVIQRAEIERIGTLAWATMKAAAA